MKKFTFLFLMLSTCLFLVTTSCGSKADNKSEDTPTETTEAGDEKSAASADSEADDESTNENADDYLGTWSYLVKGTPIGDASGFINFIKGNDGYTATISSDDETGPINNFTLKGNKFSGNFNMADGTAVDISGSMKGNALIGEVGAQGFTFKMEGERQAEE